jgi:hypothetical protein
MGALPRIPWFVGSVRGVSQPYDVQTASEALRIDRLVDLSDASSTHALQPHVCASVRRTTTFVHASNPWAHLQDSCSDPMPSCIKLIFRARVSLLASLSETAGAARRRMRLCDDERALAHVARTVV